MYLSDEDDKDVIGDEGLVQFCADIGVDPQDVITLVVADRVYHLFYVCLLYLR